MTREEKRLYQKRYRDKNKDRLKAERKVSSCAKRHNNCFECPYPDCNKG